MTFWIAAALLTSAIAALLLRVLARPGGAARTAAEADLGVYRDQLSEVARDAERGTISSAEAERSRLEISRRILDADRAMADRPGADMASGPGLVPAVLVVVGLGGAILLYERIGAPGYPDLPVSDRIARAEVLRAERPSQSEAEDYARLADLYVMATGGYVSPEAELAAGEALARDPTNGTARFYLGLMWAQTGRPDNAFRFWRALLEEGPEDAPWMAPIRAQIELLASAAGVDYTAPAAVAALKGPSADDVAAAGEMSSGDRAEMIRGMVTQLSDRLYAEGGSAEDWARLITSLGVLGETEKAKEALGKAQAAYAGQDAALEALRQAAEEAGVAG